MSQTIEKLEYLEELNRQAFGVKNKYGNVNVMQEQRIAANNSGDVDESEEDRQVHMDDAMGLLDCAKEEALTRGRHELASRLVAEPHERTETSRNCPCLSDIKAELDEGQRAALIYHTWMAEKNACISDVYDCFDDYWSTALIRAVVCSSPGQLDQVAARIRINFSIAQDSALEEIISNYIAINF